MFRESAGEDIDELKRQIEYLKKDKQALMDKISMRRRIKTFLLYLSAAGAMAAILYMVPN